MRKHVGEIEPWLALSYLVLGKPKCFQVQVGEGEGEMLESIPGHVQNMEFNASADLTWDVT